MTVININNISGIASVNAQSNSLELFDNTGASLLDLNANTATFPADISVGGGAIVGGALTVTGVLTYDDVTNIDSVGVVTARSGVHFGTAASGTLVVGDSDGIGIGTDNPTELVTVGSAVTTALFEIKPQAGAFDINVSSGDFSPHYQENFVIYNGQPDSGTARFKITKEGIITKPYQVAFFASCTIGNHDLTQGDIFQFNNIPSGQPTTFSTNHTTYNGTNVFDTTNYRFTAPVAGLYHFTVTAYFRRTSDPQTSIVPHVNGVKVTNGGNDVFFFGNTDIQDGQTLSGSVILQLAANDYVSIHRRDNSQTGTTRFYGPHSHFCGYLIG